MFKILRKKSKTLRKKSKKSKKSKISKTLRKKSKISSKKFLKKYRKFGTVPSNNPVQEPFDVIIKWIKDTTPYHATIQSLLDLPAGSTNIFLCIYRNFFDFLDGYVEQVTIGTDTEIMPSQILRDNYYLVYKKGSYPNSIKGEVYIVDGIESAQTEPNEDDLNRFHIEYAPGGWDALTDDYTLSAYNERESQLLDSDMDWSSIPTNTRIGWRGPMIPIEAVDEIKWIL